jgi:hypothetical protein
VIDRERPLLWRSPEARRPQLFRRDRFTVDQLVQAAIVILSPTALLLLSDAGAIARWGFVVGLASQPFWIYATAKARQSGMLAISILYLAFWLRGIVNHFPGLL